MDEHAKPCECDGAGHPVRRTNGFAEPGEAAVLDHGWSLGLIRVVRHLPHQYDRHPTWYVDAVDSSKRVKYGTALVR
jgi:hypothetical protein